MHFLYVLHSVLLLRVIVLVPFAASLQRTISISQRQMMPICHNRNNRPSVLFDLPRQREIEFI